MTENLETGARVFGPRGKSGRSATAFAWVKEAEL